MKLAVFESQPNNLQRVGVMVGDDRLADLNWLYTAYLVQTGRSARAYSDAARYVPADMLAFLRGGQASLAAAREALDFWDERLGGGDAVPGPAGEQILYSVDETRLRPPVPRPGKVVAAGRNYSKHLAESSEGWKEKWGRDVSASPFPIGFIKVATALVGPGDPVVYPKETEQLDYEVELAIIIGKQGKYIPPEEAHEYIAGYTVLNDISARDWQVEEMKHQLMVLGKNFDATAPLGPWLVTADEVSDPQDLDMELRVNGEVRQQSNTRYMIYKIPELVAHWSKMTLEPGDILATGTPEGVALHRKPDPAPWFLQPGDVVEAEIQSIGLLRNPIVAEE
jgi:acylpyruvate hydrolase